MARQWKNIGQAEWQVMRYIADHHPASVREVAGHMASTRGLARTSVLTVMERLREKGHLRRRKKGGCWVYSPTLKKKELLRQLVREFVETRLQGAVSPFMAYLAEETEVSDAQLDELRELVRKLERKRRSSAADSEDAP